MGIKGWEDIRAEVLRRIRARDWQPGAQIPTEEDLAAEFGVSAERIRQIEVAAMKKMKSALAEYA